MSVLYRYFRSEIVRAVLFVMLALLALFSFFDLMGELPSVNKGNYHMSDAVLYVALGMPGYIYEFMPIAVLIGTIYVLAQFASNSEFTIMRSSSLSPMMAGSMLLRIGFWFVLATFIFGEFISPYTSKLAERIKLGAIGTVLTQEFRSGLWTKDLIHEHGLTGPVVGSRFVNIKEILPNRQLNFIRVYEFDQDFQLTREVVARRAEYIGRNTWRLSSVDVTTFPRGLAEKEVHEIARQHLDTQDVLSEITPDILSVLFADPDRMSTIDLLTYIRHLEDNRQDSERYAIAFWKKLTYPFAIFVMLALALPFAYLHVRSGGVSLKIFSGIMLGMVFYLVNALFSHLGLLNTWPAWLTALLPSAAFFLIALGSLRYVERN